jgi:hypothetical protein
MDGTWGIITRLNEDRMNDELKNINEFYLNEMMKMNENNGSLKEYDKMFSRRNKEVNECILKYLYNDRLINN